MAPWQPDARQKKLYLDDHLPYEISQMRHALEKIKTLEMGPDWNDYYVAFCVHARNLTNLLTNGDGGHNFKAHYFVPNFSCDKPPALYNAFRKLDAQVLHLDPDRPVDEGKMNSRDCEKIAAWIERDFATFRDKLSDTSADLTILNRNIPRGTEEQMLNVQGLVPGASSSPKAM